MRATLRKILASLVLASLILGSGPGCSDRRSRQEADDPGASSSTIERSPPGADLDVDGVLQAALEAIDARIRADLEVPEETRAIGVHDLRDSRLAWIRPDAMFYGASVPKITIVAAWLAAHPAAVLELDAARRRELELVLKRSSNELAAKYSQDLGLDALQAFQTGRHGFFDPERGGIWSGKHYGFETPRRGDPLTGRSHTATVRKCLRYYELLEAERLVSPEVSRLLRELFAAPALDFHHDNFVLGLRGRDVTVIRKNGLWENWHLDTARIEHPSRPGAPGGAYLLVGLVEHERGGEYLARLAGEVDRMLYPDEAPRRPVHAFVSEGLAHEGVMQPAAAIDRGDDTPRAETGLLDSLDSLFTYESPVVHAPFLFNELLPSWNIDAPGGTGFLVDVRVGSEIADWTPWLEVGEWGLVPSTRERVLESGDVKVDVDWLVSPSRHGRAQLRVRAFRLRAESPERAESPNVRIDRLALAISDRTGLPTATRWEPARGETIDPARFTRRLPVPFRSQRAEDESIAGRICSPTSVAMVLAYRDRVRTTRDVAARSFDARHDIYGNWPRAVQTAYSMGVPGYIRRFGDWSEVERSIAEDQPLIISIRAKEGELRGAPYAKTAGHLLVVVGFDEEGHVEVNDPAAPDAAAGETRYLREDLERVWLANGGTAYVLEAAEPDGSTR